MQYSNCDSNFSFCLFREHSLNELTTNPDLNKNNKTFSGIEMDPDAYIRQKNYPLHEADRVSFLDLLLLLYYFFRVQLT